MISELRRLRRTIPLSVVLLVACEGGGPPPQADPDTEGASAAALADASGAFPNACALLSPAQVAAAIGEPVGQGVLEEHGTAPGESYFSTCTYTAVDDESFSSVAITLRPSPEITDPAAALDAQVADMRASAMPDYRLEPVGSLQATGGWDSAMGQLIVVRPGLLLLIDVGGPGDRRQAAEQIGTAALAALP